MGPYEILAPLGAGGMGEVYRGRDTVLNRQVAIKVLPAELNRDPGRVARLDREARLLASLSHPNIATLYALEEDSGFRLLIMELVPGETLARRLLRGPLPYAQALPIFRQLAAGLEAAHRQGIVHRDLKPDNVQITPDGGVKVLDFGLAKGGASTSPQPQEPSDSPTMTDTGTVAGHVHGTLPYMSPEQARGQPVDRQTDIWAFGCCLYQALCGRRAFQGETPSDTLADILRADPDFSALPASTPLSLRRLLARCLAKDVNRRQRDMGDVWLQLQEADEGAMPGEKAAVSQRLVVALGTALLSFFLLSRLLATHADSVAGWFFPPPATGVSSPPGAEALPPKAQVSGPDGPSVVDSEEAVIYFRLDLSQIEAALEAQEPNSLELGDGEVVIVVPKER